MIATLVQNVIARNLTTRIKHFMFKRGSVIARSLPKWLKHFMFRRGNLPQTAYTSKYDHCPSRSFLFPVLFAGLVCCLPLQTQAQTDHAFTFVRVQYGGENGGFRGAPWSHDYPTADYNIHEALERTSRIPVQGPPVVLALSDPKIFNYPVLYLCEPGYWELTEEEADNLREYLNRGGFILFDDFRGEYEGRHLEMQMQRIFPNRTFGDLPATHPIWTIFYDIDPIAAPSLVSGRYGGYGPDADRYRAIFDDQGRMVALGCFNQDIGDGWEWPDRNAADASTVSFQMGINFIMYALTH